MRVEAEHIKAGDVFYGCCESGRVHKATTDADMKAGILVIWELQPDGTEDYLRFAPDTMVTVQGLSDSELTMRMLAV